MIMRMSRGRSRKDRSMNLDVFMTIFIKSKMLLFPSKLIISTQIFKILTFFPQVIILLRFLESSKYSIRGTFYRLLPQIPKNCHNFQERADFDLFKAIPNPNNPKYEIIMLPSNHYCPIQAIAKRLPLLFANAFKSVKERQLLL